MQLNIIHYCIYLFCLENKCQALPKPGTFGKYIPSTCTTKKTDISGKCTFQCLPGFKIQGPVQKTCVGNFIGSWTDAGILPNCTGKCVYLYTISLNYVLTLLKILKHLVLSVHQVTRWLYIKTDLLW